MAAPAPNKWLITLAVMIPTLIEILDTSIANVALGHIQGSLSAGQDEVTWVLTSYLVSNAIVIPVSGFLSKVFGRRNYLIISVVIFTIASMLCGLATSLGMLVFFRIIQGLGGGGLQPMSQAILLEAYPPRERGLAMAIFAMGAVLGPILGPLLGGYITDNYSWRWIFNINVPVGILAVALIWLYIKDPDYLERRKTGESVDYIGLALLTVGLGCLQIVLDKGQQDDWFSSDFIFTLSLVAGIALTAFLVWELVCKHPVVDLRVFKDRSFATGNVVMFFGYFAFFGAIVLLPLYLQNLMGYSAFLAGVVLGPGGLIMLAVLPIVGKMTTKIDARFILWVGLLISAYSLFNMSGFSLDIDIGTAIAARNIQAVGIAFFFVPLSYLTMAYLPREAMNNASAIFNLLRNLGGSFGVAFVTTLLARRAQFHQSRLIENLTPLDLSYQSAQDRLTAYLAPKLLGIHDAAQTAGATLYRLMLRQASAMAFCDVFYAQGLMFLGLAVMMWIMKKPPMGSKMPEGMH
ncbi:Inner membrane component of tripartite multidrug resistance system [Desulfovibrio sp. DV]|uniref:DHA2 family efflux MFS transporter permease subunit n=1 Tax=Desulfovibrio sp. DV TaxID=1844708 RepID=UPI00094BC19B|nr:DHA2 family efflux MFS transporter permease subunit [Desulfovibrio sp. DV]OLN26499.1 Inner membrane component of tripartite multidrug resistance system [Desulfovibrio sp. DV]